MLASACGLVLGGMRLVREAVGGRARRHGHLQVGPVQEGADLPVAAAARKRLCSQKAAAKSPPETRLAAILTSREWVA